MQSKKNIMIDIETLGTNPNSIILSIAAVEFDIENGKIFSKFSRDVSLKSCKDLGLDYSADTLIWWINQDKELLLSQLESKNDIKCVLSELSRFIGDDSNTGIYANSPSFDCVILKNAYEKANIECPWKFWQEVDVRTILKIKPIHNRVSNNHDALSDCLNQIMWVCDSLK